MASRAGAAPDWRAAFRRSFRRATHMAGAGLLFVLLVFLTLAPIQLPMLASLAAVDGLGSVWV